LSGNHTQNFYRHRISMSAQIKNLWVNISLLRFKKFN
jgi:hypothetical protein